MLHKGSLRFFTQKLFCKDMSSCDAQVRARQIRNDQDNENRKDYPDMLNIKQLSNQMCLWGKACRNKVQKIKHDEFCFEMICQGVLNTHLIMRGLTKDQVYMSFQKLLYDHKILHLNLTTCNAL